MNRVVRRRKLLAALLAVMLGAGVLVLAVRRVPPAKVPLLDGSTMTVVPGVHLLGGFGPAAAYAVETSEGLILIDSGLDRDARILKAELAKLGLDWKNLRAVLLTHVHGDHSGGAEHLRVATGAPVYVGQADAPFLMAGAPREAIFSSFHMPGHTPTPTTVDVELKGGEKMTFGNVHLQVLDAPGHTPGSTCYLMDRDGQSVLFSGDVIVNLGDHPLGTYSAYLAPRYRGDATSYLATLRKLRALPVPDLVLPGHPRDNSRPRSPHLTAQQWNGMLDQGIRDMEDLVAQYAADGASFLDGHPKRLLPDLYYLGDFHEAALYGFFAASKFFIVDAPGGTGLLEFLHAGQKSLGLMPTDPTAVLLTACGDAETAGLADLIERCGVEVVAPPAGVELVRKLCPPGTMIRAVDELPQLGWFPATPILLGGRGRSPVAYLLPWTEKSVLISGRIPVALDVTSVETLLSDLAGSRQNAAAYVNSLRKLYELNPALWLPAVPSNGQNANLYDNAWRGLLEANSDVVHRAFQRR